MLRNRSALTRLHAVWVVLLALVSSATWLWLHLEDDPYFHLHAGAMMPQTEALPDACSPAGDGTRAEPGAAAAAATAKASCAAATPVAPLPGRLPASGASAGR